MYVCVCVCVYVYTPVAGSRSEVGCARTAGAAAAISALALLRLY